MRLWNSSPHLSSIALLYLQHHNGQRSSQSLSSSRLYCRPGEDEKRSYVTNQKEKEKKNNIKMTEQSIFIYYIIYPHVFIYQHFIKNKNKTRTSIWNWSRKFSSKAKILTGKKTYSNKQTLNICYGKILPFIWKILNEAPSVLCNAFQTLLALERVALWKIPGQVIQVQAAILVFVKDFHLQ